MSSGEIPLEVVAERVEALFPKRWEGDFQLDTCGVRFWDADADCPMFAQKTGNTRKRWLSVEKDKAFASIWELSVVRTQGDDLLEVLRNGTVSTNVYLRRLHNYAVDMGWIPSPIIPKKRWPKVVYGETRAITEPADRNVCATLAFLSGVLAIVYGPVF
jgi:hypothetical protein